MGPVVVVEVLRLWQQRHVTMIHRTRQFVPMDRRIHHLLHHHHSYHDGDGIDTVPSTTILRSHPHHWRPFQQRTQIVLTWHLLLPHHCNCDDGRYLPQHWTQVHHLHCFAILPNNTRHNLHWDCCPLPRQICCRTMQYPSLPFHRRTSSLHCCCCCCCCYCVCCCYRWYHHHPHCKKMDMPDQYQCRIGLILDRLPWHLVQRLHSVRNHFGVVK
mmetsp:Transcript_46765/g.98225  ORF Transcript_46765/g.98225 Transcript_46765/m.98225 type:complete len:214 (+) Transcript_46765:1166-1807(+)